MIKINKLLKRPIVFRRLPKEQKIANRKFSSERIIVEHFFGKMKILIILSDKFRTPRNTHGIIFKNIAGLYNMMYAN